MLHLLHGEHEAVAASCAAVPMAALLGRRVREAPEGGSTHVPEPAVGAVMGVLACSHGGQEGDRSHWGVWNPAFYMIVRFKTS